MKGAEVSKVWDCSTLAHISSLSSCMMSIGRFSVRVALCLVTLIVYAQPGVASIPFSPMAWPKDTGAPVNSSPVFGDLDGDGILEIVVGSDNNKVYAWKPDGTLMPGWPVTTGDSVRSSPALADIDGDGRLDVIVGSFDNKVYIWNFNGSLLPGWPAVTGSVVYSSPAVGDIDGDQRPEVVVGSFDNKVYAWNADGTLVRGWPKPTGLFVYSSPALADLDNDGLREVIVGTDNNRVFAWNGDGTDVEGWPTATEHVVPSSPAVGDIDNDGVLDVVVGSWDKVFVWNSRGERKTGWPVTAGHQIPSSPALADLTNDGRLEILIGCKDGRVYAWDADGQPLPGWPTITDAEISASPAVADLDGDGRLEVVIGSKDHKVYVWDATGRLLPGWPKTTGDAISSSPAIGDIDLDGTLELAIGSKDHQVYVWNFAHTGAFVPKVVWQNFHGDIAHTGVYSLPESTQPATMPTTPTVIAEPPARTPQPVAELPQPIQTPTSGQPIIPREIVDGYINDLMISDYTDTHMTLTWTAPPGRRTAETFYDIRYSPQPITEDTWENAQQFPNIIYAAPAGTREVHQLPNPTSSENLQTDLVYIAMKMVEGSAGDLEIITPLSNVVRLERQDIEPPAKIDVFEVKELNDTLLELSWQTTGDDGNTGTAMTYDIRYSEAPLNELTWLRATQIETEPTPLPAGNLQQFQIPKPWTDREIYWGIKVIDESLNISDLSEIAVWNPTDTAPPAQIVDLRITETADNTATLTWTAPGDNQHVGTAQAYEIRYADFPLTEADWASATPAENPPIPAEAGTTQTYTLQDLPPGETLFVGIRTIDSSGNIAPLSNVVEATTMDTTPPTAVTDLKVEEIGKDWVRLSWSAQGDDGQEGVAESYVLKYGENFRVVRAWTEASEAEQVPSPSSPGAQDSATLTGLQENSTYYVGLRVRDDEGNLSEISNIIRVKTLGRTIPEAVTDLIIEELRPDGVTLNWTAPQDFGEETPTVSEYDIRYALTPITEDTWDAATKFQQVPPPSAPDTLEIFTATGAPQDTEYYVALKAYDALGNVSALSNVVRVPQVDTVAPAPIIDLFVEDTGQDWVKITWTAPGDDQQQGQATSQQIRIAPTLNQLKDWAQATSIPNTLQPSPAGMQESFTIPDLASDSTFYIAVKTLDEFGNASEISNIVRAKTKDAVPPAAIQDLQPVAVEADMVSLQWTTPGDNGMTGQAEAYDIRYAEEPITPANWQQMPAVSSVPAPSSPGATETLTVSNLQPNTRYYFAVVTRDPSENLSPLSNIVDVITSDTIAPDRITTLRVETVDPTSVFLTWLSPGDDTLHTTPGRYQIRYSRTPLTESSWSQASQAEDSPIPSVQGEAERFLLSGLQENTRYHIGVKTIDTNDNASAISNIVTVYTARNVITDLSILDVSGQTATLTWTTPGGEVSADRVYDIRYALLPITEATWNTAIPATPLTPQALNVQAPEQPHEVTLINLPMDEQLFFAVRVLREDGELSEFDRISALSNVVELQRPDTMPPAAVVDLQVRDLGTAPQGMHTLELTWNAPGDNDFEGTASKYDLRYGITPPSEENWERLTRIQDLPQPEMSGTPQRAVVEIPEGEVNVYFALRTYDEALNVSRVSNIAQWTPPDPIPPAPVTDLVAERLPNGDIHLKWTAPGDNQHRGIAAFYDIRYATDKKTIEKWSSATVVPGEPIPDIAGTPQEYTIHGLDWDHDYSIALTATDDAKNTSDLSNIVTIAKAQPEQITDLAFTGETETSVTLSWTAPRDPVPGERIIRYDVRYAEQKERLEQWNRAQKVTHDLVPREPGSVESITVEELSPNMRYYFAVRAIDHKDDLSETSNIVAAETADTIPPQPVQDLTATDITPDAVTLTWTATADDTLHASPEGYEIRYSLEPFNEATWHTAMLAEQLFPAAQPGTAMEYTILGLEENTRYHVNVRAVDGNGNLSPLSNPLVARTQDVTSPQTIADLDAAFPTATSVMLSWTCPADIISSDTRSRSIANDVTMQVFDHEDTFISEYDIRYMEALPGGAPLDEQSWEQAEKVLMPPKPLSPGVLQEFAIHNLKPDTSYYFAIKAIDQSGNISNLSNRVVETTLPAEFTLPAQARAIQPTPRQTWQLVQGEGIGEMQQDDSGILTLKQTTESRAMTPVSALTAIYPGNTPLALQQGELTFQVQHGAPFMVCAKVTTLNTQDPYSLCYTTPDQFPVATAGQSPDDAPAGRVRKRIDNALFYPLDLADPAVEPNDGQWRDIRINLAQDLVEGTGYLYQAATRFFIRGTDVSLKEMRLQGMVAEPVTDFEDRRDPLENGWKLHFGTGTVELSQESAPTTTAPGTSQGNVFLHAQSATDQQIVLIYPKKSTTRLSEKPLFLANIKAGSDFKLILKVTTQDHREYYLAYLPETMFQERSASGNYIYLPLTGMIDHTMSDTGEWILVQVNIAEDLRQNQLELGYTNWMSFHGRDIRIDNIRFSTDRLDTALQ
ncbi:hypothetical protein GF339_03795 [candidate division KSB3 bacterium]|uniref:Fibronectin type-III domain-containing protein n=1 Tax=candidate division KSB3 bacterium TaxID=2044937 RepID=A0A9D5JU19_9BACT|nr:hypothetical protein [candidate division KSB3 bacterium]MBD3323681.1 hypothetical protein [candidate division KSB3 bacterium]